MTGNNRLRWNFYDPVHQGNGQQESLTQPLLSIEWSHVKWLLFYWISLISQTTQISIIKLMGSSGYLPFSPVGCICVLLLLLLLLFYQSNCGQGGELLWTLI